MKTIEAITNEEFIDHINTAWSDARSNTDAARDLHEIAWKLEDVGMKDLAKKLRVIEGKISNAALHSLVNVLQERDAF